MESNGLRYFIEQLKSNGQFISYEERVYPEPDIRNIARAVADIGDKAPGIMINNIIGYSGKRVVLHTQGSWANHAIMLGMDKNTPVKEQFFEYARRWENNNKGELEWLEDAPCKENIIRDRINLYEMIPLFRVNKNDGGMYFSKAITVTKDLDDYDNINKENVGIYRVQVQGPDTLGIQIMPFHDSAKHIQKAEERGKALPVAICLGVDPYISLMAAAPLEYEQSEYKYAASIAGKPIFLTKTNEYGIDVPAYSEYVIEGEFIPRKRFPEGPFGEFPGSYSGVRGQYRVKVHNIMHRNNPIFENLYVGRPWTEHDTLIGLTTSVPIYTQLKKIMPEVKAVNAIYQHGLTIIIATANRFGGFAKSVALRLASTPHGISYAKNIILVDEDIDPFDLVKVMWALSTRVRPEKDVIIINNIPGMPLDPSSDPPGMGGKLIIDATTPTLPDSVSREVKMVESNIEAQKYIKILKNMHIAAESLAGK